MIDHQIEKNEGADGSLPPTRIEEAAKWLVHGGNDKSKATVPQLRERFGLSPAQAIEAIREKNLILARAM